MTKISNTTLRLNFPQWQGGNLDAYHFGSQLLAWLAPKAEGPEETVDVAAPDGTEQPLQNGILGRSAILGQAASARRLIEKHSPDRIVVLGGDCAVDLVPFSYLNEKYDGELAVLWIDAHPDVLTPAEFQNAHAMVLRNLMGLGDPELAAQVKEPIKPQNIMYAGLQETSEMETAFIKEHGLRKAGSDALAATSEPVLRWLKDIGAKHLAIHFDLDVLDATKFRALYFSRPDAAPDQFDGIPQGKMTMPQVLRLIQDVAGAVDIVGLGIAEHLPWDAIELKNLLQKLPLLGSRAV